MKVGKGLLGNTVTLTAGYDTLSAQAAQATVSAQSVSSSNITVSNVYTAQAAGYYTIHAGISGSYKDSWTKEEWIKYLEGYTSEGLKEAIAVMSSKLYKELK